MNRRISAVVAVLCVVLPLAACGEGGESSDVEFRIYDTAHRADVELTNSDLVRRSVQVHRTSAKTGILLFHLTDRGEEKFRRLSRALAERGARLDELQLMAIEFNGKVYARVGVNYKRYARGLRADNGLQIVLDLPSARRLAGEIRNR